MALELLSKVVFILGILNILFLLLILLSCRCIIKNLGRKLYDYKWYRKICKYHYLLWWLFFVSVILHSVFAIIVYGNPF